MAEKLLLYIFNLFSVLLYHQLFFAHYGFHEKSKEEQGIIFIFKALFLHGEDIFS